MPKAPPSRKTPSARASPTKPNTKVAPDPKASHLYTDDNPATTIHGTGFKDKAAAERTLQLISGRSLIYQFQTVNTMYNRAKHHPAMKRKRNNSTEDASASTSDMQAAMEIFREWLDVTYPAERSALRAGGFKPLLSKKTVEKYLPNIQASKKISAEAKQFAQLYCSLGKGKRLGNVLVDDSKPTEPDWERRRYEVLDKLVPKGKEKEDGWKMSELWTEEKDVTEGHLELIAWAWSPVKEGKLPSMGKG